MKKLKNSMRHPFTLEPEKEGRVCSRNSTFFQIFFRLATNETEIVTQIIDNN